MSSFAERAIHFHRNLHLAMPKGSAFSVMNPFQNADTMRAVQNYYERYYADSKRRVGIFGINPGRFGAGLTGISFTDPVALREKCGIANDLGDRQELSSSYVYRCIDAFGGVESFFEDFYLSALCPLGFVKDNINANFYDTPELLKVSRKFIIESIERQLEFELQRSTALCFGRGKLFAYFSALNDKHKWFDNILALDHPRFIMQYRRKRLDEYTQQYCQTFRLALQPSSH